MDSKRETDAEDDDYYIDPIEQKIAEIESKLDELSKYKNDKNVEEIWVHYHITRSK